MQFLYEKISLIDPVHINGRTVGKMLLHGKSHIGLRRSVNQDNYVTAPLAGGLALCVVCDGMGGAVGGDKASKLAADIFSSEVKAFAEKAAAETSDGANPLAEEAVTEMLLRAAAAANSGVYKSSLDNRELRGMGTTLVAAFITKNEAYTLNIGDSRLYYAADFAGEDPAGDAAADVRGNAGGNPGAKSGGADSGINSGANISVNSGDCPDGLGRDEFIQVTHDHSYVQYLIDQGKITPEEAKYNPNRNIITRVIGPEKSVEPDIRCITFEGSGRKFLLLCSDGLTNMVETDEIRAILLDRCMTIEEKTDRMIKRACDGGGTDNITVVIAEL